MSKHEFGLLRTTKQYISVYIRVEIYGSNAYAMRWHAGQRSTTFVAVHLQSIAWSKYFWNPILLIPNFTQHFI